MNEDYEINATLAQAITPATIRDALYLAFQKDWNVRRMVQEADSDSVVDIWPQLKVTIDAASAKQAYADFLRMEACKTKS